MTLTTAETQIEDNLINKLEQLKYVYRSDIRDRAALEVNFRQQFEALNSVRLTDGEFARLLEDITTPDVFSASRTLRERNSFTRDDGTPLNYMLVNIRDWCKNTFEIVNQLRINTDYSHHRYDVLILINGVPVVQIELKALGISPRRAMEQIVKLNDVILGGDVLVIRTNEKSINREFLARYIRHLEQKVLQLVSGSTVFHLYATSINKLLLFIPQKQEQQKIAACLSSLDDLISAQTQKLATLKIHKKGLMQQLFPSCGGVAGEA